MKNIVFMYTLSGAGKMRGVQIENKLKLFKFNTSHTYNPKSLLLFEQCKKLHNNIIIIVKRLPPNKILNLLKQNNNIIIYDILDFTKTQKDDLPVRFHPNIKTSISYLDYIITVNRFMTRYIRKTYTFSKSRMFIIQHHYDERINAQDNNTTELDICYIGQPAKQNCMYMTKIPSINRSHIEQYFYTNDNTTYNCHFNIRDANSWNYKFKSCVKLATAAALNCNIITTRDNSIAELLPDDYPYYTTDKYDDVLKTIQYAKDTYNTDIWHKGLKQMADIKIKTSLDETIKLYIQLLNKIDK
jgi:hypothetical protein